MTSPFPEIGATDDPLGLRFDGKVTTAICLRVAARITGVSEQTILSQSRRQDVVVARFLAYWAARAVAKESTVKIGRVMQRDHTSARHGHRQMEHWRRHNHYGARRLTRRIVAELDMAHG